MIGWQALSVIVGFTPKGEGGSGGQGIACRGDLNGADVVIKVIDPAHFNPIAWSHAQAAATLRHPNVVPIQAADEFTHAGIVYRYVVMPFIDGESLTKRLSTGPDPALPTVLKWAVQLADALAAFHNAKRIHRDVKPDNVMVDTADDVVLIDLELVRYDEFPTLTGRWMLSRGYASPEHALRNQCETRSDLFSLGIVLFEMLAGRHPYGPGTPAERQDRINAGGLPDALPASVPEEIAGLVRRLLAPRLVDRPTSAAAVAAELRGYQPKVRLLGDIGAGLRVSSAKTLVDWALQHEELDLVVVNASPQAREPKLAKYRPTRGRLLIDPNTDLFAAGQTPDTFPAKAAHWGWGPTPIGAALKTAMGDEALARSILGWQQRNGADALITPYLRLERWVSDPPEDLERTRQLVEASVKVARNDWPGVPVLAGVAVPRSHFLAENQRLDILATLTGCNPAPDGVYFVLQGEGTDKAFLSVLKDTGSVLRKAGLETVLAYAGPELVPVLASGAWDVVVTGVSQGHRAPTFKVQTGGPNPRDKFKWVLAMHPLQDFRER